ncbi:NUFP2 protein, partial [Amia calva]|nr:NUFP2 protein [Amia calva]
MGGEKKRYCLDLLVISPLIIFSLLSFFSGNGKINGSTTEKEQILSVNVSINLPCTRVGNGGRQLADANFKPKPTGRAVPTLPKVGSKSGSNHKNSMDSKNDKPLDFKSREGKSMDKKESVMILNGVVALNAGYITNGFPIKPVPDNDGSGSESGYTTPKKRKARRSSVRSLENVTVLPEKAMQQGAPGPKPESELFNVELAEKVASMRLDGPKAVAKADPLSGAARAKAVPLVAAGGAGAVPVGLTGELQRKNSDSKAAGTAGKKFDERPGKAKLATASTSSKEDSWTLFKPPPVFPVDNSSAKIVPKISYASKVKENLNKAAQATGEPQYTQVPARLSQVPMSAMKTVSAASFTNGPVSGDASACSLAGALFVSAASTVPPGSSLTGGENVASSPDNSSGNAPTPSAVTGEQRKSNLFVYPLTPSNMQPGLPSAHAVALSAVQTHQKALGEIFQNQWGLSFINEPSVGPEGAPGRSAVEGKMAEVTFQGECTAALTSEALLLGRERPLFPKAYELDKRTSPQSLGSVLKVCSPATFVSEGGTPLQPHELDLQKGEAGTLGAIVFASSKDLGAESPQASPTNPVMAEAKEHGQPKGFDRRCSLGSFDLKAAVIYHTKGNVTRKRSCIHSKSFLWFPM